MIGTGASRAWRGLTIPVIISLTFVLYLLTLSRHYTADSLLYALAIENGNFRQLIDPTHLGLHPIGWTWYQIWLLLGWESRSIFPLEVLNALAGALSTGLIYIVARKISDSLLSGVLVAIGFSLSGGVWLLSVEAEFVTLPLLSSLLVLTLLLAPPDWLPNHAGYPFVLGIATAFAILLYGNNLILIPIVIVNLWYRYQTDTRVRIRPLLSYLLPVILISVPLLVVGTIVWTNGDWSAMVHFPESETYGKVSWLNIPQGSYALLRSFALYRGLAMNDSTELFLAGANNLQRLTFFFYYGMVSLIIFTPVIQIIRYRKLLLADKQREFVTVIIWSVLYALFALYWVPSDVSFWMPVLVGWWLVVCLLLFCLPINGVLSPARAHFILVLFIALMLVANATMVIIPRRELSSNRFYTLAREVFHQTESGDIIIADEGNPETIYLAYFSDRAIIPLANPDIDDSRLEAEVNQYTKGGLRPNSTTYIFKNRSLVPFNP